MKRLSFTRGVIIALALAFGSSVVVTILGGMMPFQDLIRLLVPGLSIAYLIGISSYRLQKSGWVSCLFLWCCFALSLWVLAPSVTDYLLLHVVALSFLRAVFFHKNLLSVLLDIVLSLFGLAAAFWAASHTSSVFLTTWCFFLSQAGFVVIPGSGSAATKHVDTAQNSTQFDAAHRKAEEALRQLASK